MEKQRLTCVVATRGKLFESMRRLPRVETQRSNDHFVNTFDVWLRWKQVTTFQSQLTLARTESIGLKGLSQKREAHKVHLT